MRDGVPGNALVRAFLDQRGPLRAMLLARLKNEEDVQDLLQETFLRVVEMPVCTEIGNPRAYLWRIASNLAVDRLRDARRRCRVFTSDEEAAERAPSGRPTPEEDVENRTRLREMQKILENLPPNCRQAFLLSRRDGLNYKEIASIMGVSANMIKKHLVRALGALRAGMPPR